MKWWRGWTPVLLMPAAVLLIWPSQWPRWTLMWGLAASIYAGAKWLTWRRTQVGAVPWWKHAGYLLAWPGMDAATFLTAKSKNAPTFREWVSGFASVAVGVALLFGVARLIPAEHRYVVGWIGMIGIVLILHFGAFQLLSNVWRANGVDARPLMDRPVRSVSASEFWGRRWNTAFRDLTHRFLFRPLVPWVGARGAIAGGFVFSGIIHDFVISLPARGGFGGPTLFFGIQAAAILVERAPAARRIGLGRGWRGWLFTMTALIAPVYLLFHPTFLRTIVVPFMRAVGAI